jgi:Zn-dependent protease with chaperone function
VNVLLFTILILYAVYVVVYTMPGTGQMAAIAFEMLVLTWIARNNEYMADWDGALAAGPEGLISLFELWMESSGDEGSETHPSPKARIERLSKLLD